MPVRSAEARWEGTLQEGSGTMRLAGGAYEGPYSFSSRFEEGTGTNPEELLAAAHAGCFSMALSSALGKAGFDPTSVQTTARVHLEKTDEGFRVKRIDLSTEVDVAGIDEAKFREVADGAKENCPVSALFKGSAQINLEAKLVG